MDYSMTFAVTNLVFAVMYYAFHYSSDGTQKSSWTEMLS